MLEGITFWGRVVQKVDTGRVDARCLEVVVGRRVQVVVLLKKGVSGRRMEGACCGRVSGTGEGRMGCLVAMSSNIVAIE